MNDDMLQPAGGRSVSNSRLTCAQCERMVLDAMDGTLLDEEQAQFDLHVAGCTGCTRAFADAQRGSAWLDMLKAVPPEPPALLLEHILSQTSGDPAIAIPLRPRESIFAYAGDGTIAQTGSPGQMARVLPFPKAASRNLFARAAQAAMQPRFAMTAAMAFFSVALTMNLTGVQLSDLHASSLRPSNLRHGFWSANAKAFRYYDNLRVVYELESRVRQLQRQSDEQDTHRDTAQPPSKVPPQPTAPKNGSGGRSSVPLQHVPRSRALVTTGSGAQIVFLDTPPLPTAPEHTMLLLRACSTTASAASYCGEGAQV